MNSSLHMNRKLLVIISAGLILALSGWLAYDMLTFRLKSTTPQANEVATASPFMKFNFSQPIKSIGEASLTYRDETYGADYKIEGSSVLVYFPSTLEKETDYTAKITDIKSQWLENSLSETSLRFTPTYRDYNDLSEEEQKQLVQESAGGQIDDPFLNNQFPLIGDGFYIEAERNPTSDGILLNIVILSEVYNYDTNTQTFVSDTEAEEYYKKAMELIRSRQGTPEKYDLVFSNPYLNLKYNPEHQD